MTRFGPVARVGRIRGAVAALAVSMLALAGCGTVTPIAVPEPVAANADGALDYYTRVYRDTMTALSTEFPQLRFVAHDDGHSGECVRPDGSRGTAHYLGIHISAANPGPEELPRAVAVFEGIARRAGFSGRMPLPADTGVRLRMFAADGSYITFRSVLATVVALRVGCYPP